MGVGCFYDHPDYFGNIFKSSRTIFALINGDSILFIFQELQKNTDMGYLVRAIRDSGCCSRLHSKVICLTRLP